MTETAGLPRPAAIVWDWDNTLVDGWAAIAAGLNAAFAAFDLPGWTVGEVKARVRRSLRESFPELFGAGWERARDVFYAEVRARHLGVLSPMPGALEALRAGAALAPMAVNSNKQGPLLRAEAAHLGWEGLFRALVGAADAEADKPDPAPMRLALRVGGLGGNGRTGVAVADRSGSAAARPRQRLAAALATDGRAEKTSRRTRSQAPPRCAESFRAR